MVSTTPADGEGPVPVPPGADDDPHRAALAPVLERVAARVSHESAEAGLALARAACRRIPAERLRALDPDALAARLAGAFAFVDRREPGSLGLRVLNPTMDEHGYRATGTVVEINVEDGPFVLSTATEELSRLGLQITEVLQAVVGVERDGDGRVTAVLPARQARRREVWVHLELEGELGGDGLDGLDASLRRVLADAQVATRDFRKMRAQVEEVAFQTRASAGSRYSLEEVDETLALLYWLIDDHFVLLGYREYDLFDTDQGRAGVVRPGSGLGILADERSSAWAEPVPLAELDPALRQRLEGGDLLVVSRTNRLSTVHHQVRMLYVGVKKVSPEGEIAGESRFLGLFAQRAYAEPASTIPVLRRKLRQILEAEDIVDHSHDERALRALFEAFPKHELFEASTQQLRRTLLQLLEIQKGHEVRLLCRVDPRRRSASALVAVPRGRFNATIRRRVQQLLVERFEGSGCDYHLSVTEGDQALMHFIIHATDRPGGVAEINLDELERDIRALSRTWADALKERLVAVHGEERGAALARAYAGRFPAGYTDVTDVQAAEQDIAVLEALDDTGVGMALRPAPDAEPPTFRFKLYKVGPGAELSSFLPLLESLGLTVIEEVPHRLEATGGEAGPRGVDPRPEVHIQDFAVRVPAAVAVDVERDGARVAEAARAIWDRRAEADSLNRLVLSAGLRWDEVAVLRAYRRYRRQVGTSFTEEYQNEALYSHPQVARALLELFAARFDPARDATPADVDAARRRVLDGCDAVERLDVDRILRGYLGLVDATLRTNRWVPGGRSFLALKFDSARVPDIPKPVPHVEVFVYAVDSEAVHLRGGPVARGGIRWSDRLEDFRTEVLGLMKAQMTKNAVIVPTGSKGGFVLKRPPAEPQLLAEDVRRCYETFIRGLLDVTDNVIGDDVVPPPGVRRADGDDPYLVVAADRGTATFSDVANAISAEYGFWLGDAFASGGSRGYDHKAMGITARGTWAAVQRHFRELGIDVQAEPITVVGIGDMSGDVFGNGLLRSDHVKLVAAFDHRDIFIDPDPDPQVSFAERARLYGLPGSSWQDYDRALISPGGGVWSRALKAIPLSEQARRALRVSVTSLSPPEVVRAILCAPADLLFAGGIGTFVKASDEAHADVGDRANDAVRVDAAEVAARVVGEGGNLAFTQRARIQYARRGGRINTDAIDNSAGVDTSDREVNLKILLGAAVDARGLTLRERDALLAAMTDDVAAQVLRDVYLQTWAISQELVLSPHALDAYEQFMLELTETGRLDRDVEVLPSTREMEHRREAGAGFTRPELAVLLGYSKVDLAARLLASPLPDQPQLQHTLTDYFPPLVVERFARLVARHRLRRELVGTLVANDLVNRMGVTWASRSAHELGCMTYETAAAYWIAREVADADSYWRAIEDLDGQVDPGLQLELKAEVDRLVDVFARIYLREPAATDDIAAAVARDRPTFDELEKFVAQDSAPLRRAARSRRAERFSDAGLDPDLAERIAGLTDLTLVPDVAAVVRDSGRAVRDAGEAFFRLSEALPLDRLHARLVELSPTGYWERWQQRGLIDDLRDLRRTSAAHAVAEHRDALGAEAVDRFLAARTDACERVDSVVRDLEREPAAALPAIAVAVRALREALAS